MSSVKTRKLDISTILAVVRSQNSTSSSDDWTLNSSTDDIYNNNNSGRVAINKDTADYTLDVNGDFKSTTIIDSTGSKGMAGQFLSTTGDYLEWKAGSGTQGPKGDPGGPQGNQGIIGFQGPQGNNGNTGIQGSQGNQGQIGLQGSQGIVGFQGPQGNEGNIGVQGPQGITGSQGIVGVQGPQGITGSQGIVGVQGPQGNEGNIGVQGPQGNEGNIGVQGPQGITGFQGTQGNEGNIGYQGVQGSQGMSPSIGYAVIRERQNAGVNAGYSFSSTTLIRRRLNNVVSNGITISIMPDVSGNFRITEEGTYAFRGRACYSTAIPSQGYRDIFNSRIHIANETLGLDNAITGDTEKTNSFNVSVGAETLNGRNIWGNIDGILTLAANTVLSMKQYSYPTLYPGSIGANNAGIANNVGGVEEVYAVLTIQKLS